MAFCGLYVYLELAGMFPRSGGEKVYLEAVYKRPKLLMTTLFGINAVVLGFTASGTSIYLRLPVRRAISVQLAFEYRLHRFRIKHSRCRRA